MTNLSGVKPGDELLLVRRGRADSVTVHKVGRKFVHILRYPDYPDSGTNTYLIESGRRNDNYGHEHLTTREAYAERQESIRVTEALSRLGIEFRHGMVPLETKKVILALMETEQDR